MPNLLPDNMELEHFFEREQNDLFTELSFNSISPICKQEPHHFTARKALDDIIFDESGLTKEERRELYCAIAELVRQWLDKAGSR